MSDLPDLALEGGEVPREDTIRVICRFRPLNDAEERAGSKFVVKFPAGSEDQCVSIGVSYTGSAFTKHLAIKIVLKGPLVRKSNLKLCVLSHCKARLLYECALKKVNKFCYYLLHFTEFKINQTIVNFTSVRLSILTDFSTAAIFFKVF